MNIWSEHLYSSTQPEPSQSSSLGVGCLLQGTRTGQKMSEKAADVQRKALKAWRTITQDYFEKLQESLTAWKENMKK